MNKKGWTQCSIASCIRVQVLFKFGICCCVSNITLEFVIKYNEPQSIYHLPHQYTCYKFMHA